MEKLNADDSLQKMRQKFEGASVRLKELENAEYKSRRKLITVRDEPKIRLSMIERAANQQNLATSTPMVEYNRECLFTSKTQSMSPIDKSIAEKESSAILPPDASRSEKTINIPNPRKVESLNTIIDRIKAMSSPDMPVNVNRCIISDRKVSNFKKSNSNLQYFSRCLARSQRTELFKSLSRNDLVQEFDVSVASDHFVDGSSSNEGDSLKLPWRASSVLKPGLEVREVTPLVSQLLNLEEESLDDTFRPKIPPKKKIFGNKVKKRSTSKVSINKASVEKNSPNDKDKIEVRNSKTAALSLEEAEKQMETTARNRNRKGKMTLSLGETQVFTYQPQLHSKSHKLSHIKNESANGEDPEKEECTGQNTLSMEDSFDGRDDLIHQLQQVISAVRRRGKRSRKRRINGIGNISSVKAPQIEEAAVDIQKKPLSPSELKIQTKNKDPIVVMQQLFNSFSPNPKGQSVSKELKKQTARSDADINSTRVSNSEPQPDTNEEIRIKRKVGADDLSKSVKLSANVDQSQENSSIVPMTDSANKNFGKDTSLSISHTTSRSTKSTPKLTSETASKKSKMANNNSSRKSNNESEVCTHILESPTANNLYQSCSPIRNSESQISSKIVEARDDVISKIRKQIRQKNEHIKSKLPTSFEKDGVDEAGVLIESKSGKKNVKEDTVVEDEVSSRNERMNRKREKRVTASSSINPGKDVSLRKAQKECKRKKHVPAAKPASAPIASTSIDSTENVSSRNGRMNRKREKRVTASSSIIPGRDVSLRKVQKECKQKKHVPVAKPASAPIASTSVDSTEKELSTFRRSVRIRKQTCSRLDNYLAHASGIPLAEVAFSEKKKCLTKKKTRSTVMEIRTRDDFNTLQTFTENQDQFVKPLLENRNSFQSGVAEEVPQVAEEVPQIAEEVSQKKSRKNSKRDHTNLSVQSGRISKKGSGSRTRTRKTMKGLKERHELLKDVLPLSNLQPPEQSNSSCREPTFSPLDSSHQIYLATTLSRREYICGFLKLNAGYCKPRQIAEKHVMLFTIVEGEAEVGVEDQSTILKHGSTFKIRLKKEYYIKNISDTLPLLLSFTRIRQNS